MNSRSLLLCALLASFVAQAQNKTEEEAGDVSEVDKDSSGPLKDRVRPVSGHLFLMKKRFEISPGLGLSVRDAFYTKLIPGLALTYHFTDAYAVSLRGGYAISLVSGAAQICTTGENGSVRGCAGPSPELLAAKKAFGNMGLQFGLEFQWSPIYGKLSLIAEKFLHFNMYAAGGPVLVFYGPNQQVTVGGNLGIGFRFFVNKFMTVRLEFRDVLYYESFGTGDNESSFRNQLLGELGFSFFLPTVFEPG